MEEGSLLREALQHQQNPQDLDKSSILLDVYSLRSDLDHASLLLHLAELAGICNQFIASQGYSWHTGGDGPVFGVHVTDGVAHLRAVCRYGVCVMDEWMAVDMLLELSKTRMDIVVSCWDFQDGQVILIQTAHVLPEWVDQDPSDTHRFACWLQQGRIQLFRKSHVTIQQALEMLSKKDEDYSIPVIQQSLQAWLTSIRSQARLTHRTPIVLPRKVAYLIRQRPDLIHAAIQAFGQHMDEPAPNLMEQEDWVWTTCTTSRTNYAMIRTMVSPEWETPERLPRLPMETKRFQKQCVNEVTPHVRHALELGVRIVVGFEFLRQSPSQPPVSMEQRMANWSRLDRHCCGGKEGEDWILQAFQRGPNYASHNLDHLLKCPVFPEEEADFLTLRSHPDTSLKQQILQAEKGTDDEEFLLPRPEHVDDESWMDVEGNRSEDDLDGMLSKFQSFLVQPSGPEGVESSSPSHQPTIKLEIRPRVVLNLLHAVLKGQEIVFPTKDPFFFQEDYDLMDDDGDNEDSGMKDIMVSLTKNGLYCRSYVTITSIAHIPRLFFRRMPWIRN
jgi:hypothetical protein